MSSHRRVKDIAYDEDDVYSDEDEAYDDNQGYTAEDKQNFADLTPVVQAHLIESEVQATTKEIEEALWHYYWDVAKSVEYIKKQHTTKQTNSQPQKQSKTKDKFDQAVEKQATTNGKSIVLLCLVPVHNPERQATGSLETTTDTSERQCAASVMLATRSLVRWHSMGWGA